MWDIILYLSQMKRDVIVTFFSSLFIDSRVLNTKFKMNDLHKKEYEERIVSNWKRGNKKYIYNN